MVKSVLKIACLIVIMLAGCTQGGVESKSKYVFDLDAGDFAMHIESGVTLVDFWAPWCGPCRMQGPVVDEVADHFEKKITVGKINVDDVPSVAQEYGIRSIPTLIIFKDGEIERQFTGLTPKDTLIAALDDALEE